MQLLINLIKIGAIGASLAFLLLSFRLLKGEQEVKDSAGSPTVRPEMLREIRKFRISRSPVFDRRLGVRVCHAEWG
jgi:hypothetical protein